MFLKKRYALAARQQCDATGAAYARRELRNKRADHIAERQPVNNGSAEIDGAEPSATEQVHNKRALHTAQAVSINLQQPSAKLIERYSTTIRVLREPS
jgi:hypothetical protein